MYKGKRRRLRKKDLLEVNTFHWLSGINLSKARMTLTGGKRRFFTRSIRTKLDFSGLPGDILDLSVNLSLISEYGVLIIDNEPYVLLPRVEGRKYYLVDEEQA